MIAYPLDWTLVWYGLPLTLNLAFDNILRLIDMQKDELMTDEDKLVTGLQMLVSNYEAIQKRSLADKAEIMMAIQKNFIDTDKRPKKKDAPVFDFFQDSSLIYSSFMMDYGIDLIEQQGKLGWQQFTALLQGLSERTKLREVINIRSRPLPKPTQHNAEEIKLLSEAKAFYALKTNTDTNNYEEQLDRFGANLERMARANGKG